MTAQSIETQKSSPSSAVGIGNVFSTWRENPELVLAAVTLIALLVGWLGGSVSGILPGWAVLASAVVAFAAGGYSGVTGAIEEARQGKLDIDFPMIAAALAVLQSSPE